MRAARESLTSARRDAALMCACVLAMGFLLAQLLDFGYGRDQGVFAIIGRTIVHGGVPYRDAWDIKPPGIFFVYALAFEWFGGSAHAIRILEALSLMAMSGAFVVLSRHYVGDWRPGVLSAALAILGHVQLEFWHTAQPESFGAAFVAVGLMTSALAMDDDAGGINVRLLWVLTGVCTGAATLLKPTIGVGLAGTVVIGAWRLRSVERRAARIATLVGCVIVGASVAPLLCVAFFVHRGGMAQLSETLFSFVPHHAALPWQRIDPRQLFVLLLDRWLFAFSAVNAAGLVCLGFFWPRGPALDGVIHVGVALGLLLIGTYTQARLYPYHFGSALPMTALLAGWGFWQLWVRLRPTGRGSIAFAVFLAALVSARSASPDSRDSFAERCALRFQSWTTPTRRDDIRDRLYTVVDYHAHDNRLAVSWLTQHTKPGDRIFVYGFTPEIYVAADRELASRYTYDVALRSAWSRDEAREELMQDFRAHEPAAILIEHGDPVSDVTGAALDSAADAATFPALRSLLAERYERQTSSPKFEIFMRIR